MAELILTEEEKAAESFLDWDDETLGKFAKYVALELRRLERDDDGLLKVSAASCAVMLVGLAFEANADHLTLDIEGHARDGTESGDWRITVERMRRSDDEKAP